jgi:pyridoxamine 5'-phosphate oxidase
MSIFDDFAQLRRDYGNQEFSERTALANPFRQFAAWFAEALACGMLEPNAMALSTTGKDCKPTSRIVLLKKFDESGFVFFTNFESEKGSQLGENQYASLLFYWDRLGKQVRINGVCSKISAVESDEYFQTRPYTSRLGAWASQQSRPLKSRFTLIRQVVQYMLKYPKNVPLPPFWGGYRIVPDYFEFWLGRESRLHDRISYTLTAAGNCIKQRLYP